MASAFLLPLLQCGLQPQMVLEVGHVVGFKVVTCFLVKTGVGLEVGNNREHVSFKHHKWTTSFVSGVPCFRHPCVAGGKKKSRDTYRSKATAQVNDRYFVSDVTSYSAGNFTAVTGQQWSRGKLCGYEQRQIKCVGSTRRCKHFPPLDVGFSHGRLCSHQIYSSSKQSAYLFNS